MTLELVDDAAVKQSIEPIALSVPQAAAACGIGETLMQELILSGTIPSVKLSRRRVVPVQALREWFARQTASN
ncbi:MAG TPA: helix-turn-helix domain-containing protein [Candidatus Xenobia bacterium]|jgi:hypothetical protein